MKRLFIEKDGERHKVYAEKVKGRLWFHFQGQTYDYKPESSSHNTGDSVSLNPGQIVSPMPGKILKVPVKAGQVVRAGEVVLIIEAMKMEYSLESDIDGKVSDFQLNEGQQVEKGQLLITVEGED